MEEKNLWNKVNTWSEELELLRTIISQTELVETVKWGGPVFTLNGKNVLGIGGFKNYFTIWFFKGVFLKDEKKVLINAQEGLTKALRQWRFPSKEALQEEIVMAYIREAIENEKLGKKIKSESTNIAIPVLFQKVLDENKNLATAFLRFSPYRQKEFLEYIESAKREATRLSRIEKIKLLIMENRGLNDSYK